MKFSILSLLLLSTIVRTHALLINEVMSNPTGDDSGREWIELYNNGESSIDLNTLTISIKGGSFLTVTPVSGGIMLDPGGYAIVGSTVSGATKFMLDYPSYTGILLRSSINLVNTGMTSIDIKSGGVILDSLPSYTAAKEGNTYSLIGGNFTTGTPTPGEENKSSSGGGDATTTDPGPQMTIPVSSPSADIVVYLPTEKVVVAGAPSLFSVYSLTREGKAINNVSYVWSFGDGGERTGSSTLYRYFYPGKYIAQVEATNSLVAGTGRMTVKVVAPDLRISTILNGKYGKYVDITNPNKYDLDVSGWKLSIDGALFSFPKNTILSEGVTHIPGLTMGFASTTVASSTIIKLLFPNMDEVLRVPQEAVPYFPQKVYELATSSPPVPQKINFTKPVIRSHPSSSLKVVTASTTQKNLIRISSIDDKKDTKIASFIKSFLSR